MVGTTEVIDKLLPSNIISIHRTNNQHELAEIYSAADVFVNPTREDTFPTVNIEALACGTPVITFDIGGSPEILDDFCGMVVENNDISSLIARITNIPEKKDIMDCCLSRARNFEFKAKFTQYIELYLMCC